MGIDKRYDKGQVLLVTLKKLDELIKRDKIDMSALKVFVIDEADIYFADDTDNEQLKRHVESLPSKPQFLLFSATFSDEVLEKIKTFMEEARQIRQKQQDLKLDNIKQFYLRCESKKKLDYISEIFDYCLSTQTIIFANSRKFCEITWDFLKNKRG